MDEEPFEDDEDVRLDILADRSLWFRFVNGPNTCVEELPLRWLSPGRVTDLYYQYTSVDPSADHAS